MQLTSIFAAWTASEANARLQPGSVTPWCWRSLWPRSDATTGETQIGKVLTHALREANQRKINAVVFVGDCCEESRDKLVGPAKQLAGLKVPVFMFQEGGDQIARMRLPGDRRTDPWRLLPIRSGKRPTAGRGA